MTWAPRPWKLAIMALSGCISTIWAVVATNLKVSYERLLVVVEADRPDDQPTIAAVRCDVTVDQGRRKQFEEESNKVLLHRKPRKKRCLIQY
jgi:uncharacterized OsmC-like protein